jgi:hypothetical protein
MTNMKNPGVDMSKVRAFNAKKAEQQRAQVASENGSGGRAFFDEGATVRVDVSIGGQAPVQTKTPSKRELAGIFAANAMHWQVIIYETIGTVLGLELNAAMPPGPLYMAVAARLKEMSDSEKTDIPAPVWDYIQDLQQIVHGDTDIPALRDKKSRAPRSGITPLTVKQLADDTYAIFPVGDNSETLSRVMDANVMWNHWRSLYPCSVRGGEKGETLSSGEKTSLRGYLVIQCDNFLHWPDAERIRDLFSSFDKPIEGRLVTPAPPVVPA